MSDPPVRIHIPAHFTIQHSLYAQGRNEREERWIEAPRSEVLAWAFTAFQAVFADVLKGKR